MRKKEKKREKCGAFLVRSLLLVVRSLLLVVRSLLLVVRRL